MGVWVSHLVWLEGKQTAWAQLSFTCLGMESSFSYLYCDTKIKGAFVSWKHPIVLMGNHIKEEMMSSEQQERQAIQYAERSAMFTVKALLKLLEWSARHALAQDSAYKIGVQKLEELLQSPYAIESLNISKDILDKPVDVEKFKELVESENLPIAISWQGDYLHFYAKDKSLLDKHLDELLQKLVSNPEKLQGLTMDKTLDEEIAQAKEQIVMSEPSAVKTKEVIL